VDLKIVWRVVTKRLPLLKRHILVILSGEKQSGKKA
jgi:uncharacterized protein with HEPN domain